MLSTDWLDYELIGNTVLSWAIAAGVFIGVWFALLIARRLIVRRLDKLAKLNAGVLALDVAEEVASDTRAWFL